MKIVVLAAAERGRRCLKSLLDCADSKDDIAVFTFPEEPWEPAFVQDIKEISKINDIDFFLTNKVHDSKYQDFWKGGCDIIFVIGWRYLIPFEIYNLAKRGCYVFHDSYLPSYRGFGPTVWSIRNGENKTGTSLFKISEKMDEGPILFQKKIMIENDDYISDVMEKVTKENEILIQKAYRSLVDVKVVLTEQDHKRATYTCKNIPDDFRIDWSNNAIDIINLIRSYSNPYPGAFTTLNGQKVSIFRAKMEKSQFYIGYIPGRVKSINKDGTVTVFCGDGGILRLEKIMVDGELSVKPSNIIKSIGGTLV
jgi:methionyl-tRNA formyltransferase